MNAPRSTDGKACRWSTCTLYCTQSFSFAANVRQALALVGRLCKSSSISYCYRVRSIDSAIHHVREKLSSRVQACSKRTCQDQKQRVAGQEETLIQESCAGSRVQVDLDASQQGGEVDQLVTEHHCACEHHWACIQQYFTPNRHLISRTRAYS